MVFILDNYDSFTFNLVQYIGAMGEEIIVQRNDAISVAEIRSLNPSAIVISPGPCTPAEAGISVLLIAKIKGICPILGVCLGHQSIAVAFNGRVVRAREPVHGKVSKIHHDGRTIFRNVLTGFSATRYHSLVIERESLPDCLEVSAWTDDGVIMAVRHREYAIEGVQFHPESILTKEGKSILGNFLSQLIH